MPSGPDDRLIIEFDDDQEADASEPGPAGDAVTQPLVVDVPPEPSTNRRAPRSPAGPSVAPERAERASRLALVLRRTAAGLGLVAVILAGLVLGWWLRGHHDGKLVSIDVRRPVRVLRTDARAPDEAPNVLGLDVAEARQVFVDAGVDPANIVVRDAPYVGRPGTVIEQQPGAGERGFRHPVLTRAVAAVMPQLVGTTAADARTKLADLGARVVTRTRYVPGVPENEVIESLPAAGATIHSDVTLITAEAPSGVFLAQLNPVTDECSTDTVDAGGREYKDAIVCDPGVGESRTQEYVLNRRVTRFTAVAALADRSSTDEPVDFQVFVDNRLRFSRSVAFGSQAKIDVSTTGALRLRIVTKLAGSRSQSSDVRALWGVPRLVGGSSAMDALVRESGG